MKTKVNGITAVTVAETAKRGLAPTLSAKCLQALNPNILEIVLINENIEISKKLKARSSTI